MLIHNLKFLLLYSTIVCACSKTTDHDAELNVLGKKYDEVCFLMTHNSMNNSEKGFVIPNQTHSITNQLENGVRGLMLDTYDGDDGIALTYHGVKIMGKQKLVDALLEVKVFLVANPKEIVTIIFQNEGSNEQLQTAIESIGLDKLTYTHTAKEWPTIQTMIDKNQRLVLFVEFNKTPQNEYLMYAWGDIFDTNYTYKNIKEFDTEINRGKNGTKDLYLINHWLANTVGLPDKNLAHKANKRDVLGKRVQDCSVANDHFINFLGVDFYEIGDAKAIVDSINAVRLTR